MKKPPTLQEILRKYRTGALAGGSAIAMLATGCPAPEEEIAGGITVPDVTPDAVQDAVDDGVRIDEPAGAPDPGMPGPEDVIPPPNDVLVGTDMGAPPPDPNDVFQVVDDGAAPDVAPPDVPPEPDLPLAGGIPMPDPGPDAQTPAAEDAP